MDVIDSATTDEEKPRDRERDRWIGVYIGILAVILAICAMGGGNAAKEATLKNIEASNIWAFFQAKNMRRQVLRSQIEALELAIITTPSLDPAAKASLEQTIAAHRAVEARLTSDPASNEGLDELFTRAKAIEAERDLALRQDPYFDYGEAMLQIAIVMASIAIVTGGTSLLIVSGILGLLGVLLTINGFGLFVSVPFLA